MNSKPASTLPDDTAPCISAFYSYWLSLPKVKLIPTLSDYFDHAPPTLQPFVGICDVYSPTQIVMRLLGTGLVEASGSDPTGGPLDEFYAEKLRQQMGLMAYTSATHPVGYLCVRTIRLRGGNLIHCPSICLPISNSASPVPGIITYARVAGSATTFANQNTMEMVQDLRMTTWIDVGAGVPDQLIGH